jgi:hypothetical protein
MSDYSPPPSPDAFDELEDVLYDADPAPDLVDELTAHVHHSPLLWAQDFEPGYELQEYYSDWDYYSDDYYDDDPTILRRLPIDGSEKKAHGKIGGTVGEDVEGEKRTSRSRKRKLGDRDERLGLDERRYLRQCIRGTVWATPLEERDNVYYTGHGEKVALLKDWKVRFGTNSPRRKAGKAKGKPQLPTDESWANDLSLADMGLRNERGSRSQGPEEVDQESDDASETEGEESELDEAEVPDLPDVLQPDTIMPSSPTEEQPVKRRKRHESATEDQVRPVEDEHSSVATQTGRRGRSQRVTAIEAAPGGVSRKRKASPAPSPDQADDESEAGDILQHNGTISGPMATTAGRGAKHPTHSTRVMNDSEDRPSSKRLAVATATGPARATRSRKK